MTLRVEEISDIAQLAPFRTQWHELHQQMQDASFFHTLEWLEIYWKHFGAGQKLRTLVVSHDEKPVGILPLTVIQEQSRLGQLRTLTYPLHNWGSFYGPISPDPAATLTAGLDHIRRTKRDWDLLELRWMRGSGPAVDLAEAALRKTGFQAYKTCWDRAIMIDQAGTWDEYFSTRKKKWRTNFRRWQRRLEEQGHVEYLRYRPAGAARGEGDPRWDLYDTCLDIARRSWQGSSTTGTTLSHDSIRLFLREVHGKAAEMGAVDLNLMLLDGQPFAFAYNYHCRGYVYGLRVGYDPSVADNGVGNVLYSKIIEDNFQRGDHLYDLGIGYLECKKYLLTRVEPILRLSHFPLGSLRAQILRFKRWQDSRDWQANQTAAQVPSGRAVEMEVAPEPVLT
jgi:CelD/BcsL family acetyltransferase involved in cellulose biosynthesis